MAFDPKELDDDGLTIKERKAVDNFLLWGKQKKALKRAGYPCGPGFPSRFFARERVRAVLERELRERHERYKLSADWVAEELAFLARSRVTALYHEDGTLKQPHELDDATAAAVLSVKFYEGEISEYKLSPKNEAIRLAMQYLKMLDGEGGGHKDRLQDVIDAMKAGPVKKNGNTGS